MRFGSEELVKACLPVQRSDRLRAKASEHAILLAEPTFQTREAREAVLTAMFEKQRPPAVFLAKNAVLASFATGRQTSLVVDAGHQCTTGTPTPPPPLAPFPLGLLDKDASKLPSHQP